MAWKTEELKEDLFVHDNMKMLGWILLLKRVGFVYKSPMYLLGEPQFPPMSLGGNKN
jgi:hypothetical protein